MTTIMFLVILLFTPSLWPLIWTFLVAVVFGVSVFANSPSLDTHTSQPHAAESSPNNHVNQKGI